MVVPDHDELRIKLLRHFHDLLIGGHPGRVRTLDLLSRHYYWPKMYEHVRRFVASCHICSRSKAWRTSYSGVLKPLPIPQRRWRDISIDFVVELPESRGCTNIMVVVDRLTKMRHLITCSTLRHRMLRGCPSSIFGSCTVSPIKLSLTEGLRLRPSLEKNYAAACR